MSQIFERAGNRPRPGVRLQEGKEGSACMDEKNLCRLCRPSLGRRALLRVIFVSVMSVISAIGFGCTESDSSATNGSAGASAAAPGDPPVVGAASESTAQVKPVPEDYPLEVCVVSGEKLGSMGNPVAIEVRGRTVMLCCAHCESVVRAAPEKYLSQFASAAGGSAAPASGARAGANPQNPAARPGEANTEAAGEPAQNERPENAAHTATDTAAHTATDTAADTQEHQDDAGQ